MCLLVRSYGSGYESTGGLSWGILTRETTVWKSVDEGEQMSRFPINWEHSAF